MPWKTAILEVPDWHFTAHTMVGWGKAVRSAVRVPQTHSDYIGIIMAKNIIKTIAPVAKKTPFFFLVDDHAIMQKAGNLASRYIKIINPAVLKLADVVQISLQVAPIVLPPQLYILPGLHFAARYNDGKIYRKISSNIQSRKERANFQCRLVMIDIACLFRHVALS